MSALDGLCGYAVTDDDGEQQPCDRPATGWRWYQDCEHEDLLDVACDWHANEGGRRIAAAEAIARLAEESEAGWRRDADEAHATAERVRALADKWDERLRPGMVGIAKAIRAALDQPAPTTPGGDA